MIDNSVVIAAATAAIVVLAVLLLWWWRRRRAPSLLGALESVAIDQMRDILVPDGMGGHIHVEHLLLTAQGLLLIEIKPFEGAVFASDRMDDWTVISKQGRFAFPNPQRALYDRVAAVRQLLRDVPVTGYVMFPGAADFSKGRPKDILLPPELLERYKKPDRNDIERLVEAFWPHWETVKSAVDTANNETLSAD